MRSSGTRVGVITQGQSLGRLEEYREKTRSRLAQALVALLIVVSLLLIVLDATRSLNNNETKDLAGVVLSPLIAVTGTALGFYFGGHRYRE